MRPKRTLIGGKTLGTDLKQESKKMVSNKLLRKIN
jgi:hypothetical protein